MSSSWDSLYSNSDLSLKAQDSIFVHKVLPLLDSKSDAAAEDFIRSISRSSHPLLVAATLREAIQRFSQNPALSNTDQATRTVQLKKLNKTVKIFLLGHCSSSNLVLKQVSERRSNKSTLYWITKEESNLSYSSKIPDIESRLNSARHCYAIFHRDDVDFTQPLSFVHVALTQKLARSLEEIENLHRLESSFSHAMFYSINSCFKNGLSGVGISNQLISMVKSNLFDRYPNLKVASTLSPIPGFQPWLAKISLPEKLSAKHMDMVNDALSGFTPVDDAEMQKLSVKSHLAYILQQDPARLLLDDERASKLKEPLLFLCANYLNNERSSFGNPFDAVAKFHLGNGAELGRINWLADTRIKALQNSAGMMVNYIYHDRFLVQNRKNLLEKDQVELGYDVREILGLPQRPVRPRPPRYRREATTSKSEEVETSESSQSVASLPTAETK